MAQGDRPAVDVQLVRVDRQLVKTGQDLGGECLVEFHQIDIVHGQAGQLERLLDGGDRTESEQLGLDAGGGERHEPSQRGQPQCFGSLGRCHDDRRCAVAGLRRVPCRHAALGVEGWSQLAQSLGRRISAGSLIGIECDLRDLRAAAVGLFAVHNPHRDRNDLVGKASLVDRGHGTLVAAKGERILLLARDLRLVRMVFRDESGRQVDVGVRADQLGVGGNLVSAHRDQAHRLCSARHDRLCRPKHDPLGGEGNGLETGRAEPVDRDRRRLHRDTRPEAGDPRDVQTLLGFGHRASKNHVVNLRRLDAWGTSQRLGHRHRRQVIGTGRSERALRRLADRSADRGNDHGISHGW